MRTLRYKPSKCTNHSQSDHNILIVLITTRQSFKRQGTLLYDLVRKKCTMAFCSEGELLTLRDWLKTAESSLTLPRRRLHENYELREYRRDNFDQSQHVCIAVLISMFGPSAHIYDLTCCEVDSCNFLQMFSRPPYCRMKLRFLNKTTKTNG